MVALGIVADAEEHEADGERPSVRRSCGCEFEALEVFFFDAEALFDHGVVQEVDLLGGRARARA